MANENEFLIHAFFIGGYITFLYDILRILRRVVPHGVFLVSLEDICFWIYCAGKVFLLMYYESNGTLRWFAVLGALAGMLLYRRLASPYFVRYVSLVLQKILRVLAKAVGILWKPVRALLGKIREELARLAKRSAVKLAKKRKSAGKGLKKKLTFLLRMVKMN